MITNLTCGPVLPRVAWPKTQPSTACLWRRLVLLPLQKRNYGGTYGSCWLGLTDWTRGGVLQARELQRLPKETPNYWGEKTTSGATAICGQSRGFRPGSALSSTTRCNPRAVVTGAQRFRASHTRVLFAIEVAPGKIIHVARNIGACTHLPTCDGVGSRCRFAFVGSPGRYASRASARWHTVVLGLTARSVSSSLRLCAAQCRFPSLVNEARGHQIA